ncbi:MAG TPA: ComEC/Rec2 family competence protein [Polyangiaceae bacterium]|nr:ComEC/Rec2 family competence protein [Polyangiaceae bacterium]
MHESVLIDGVLVVAGAAVVGGLLAGNVGAVLVASVCIAALLAGKSRWPMLGVALVVFALSAVRARHAVAVFERSLVDVRTALGAPRRCSGSARVVTSPVSRADTLGFVADFESLDCEGRSVAGLRAHLYGGPPDLARGDRIDVVAQLAPTELFQNAELADPAPSAARSGVTASGAALDVRVVRPARSLFALVDRFRARVRARIDATFVPAAAPMARALVLGENDLSNDDNAAFRASGLAHLLAVSGTHLVVAVLGIVRALSFLLVRVEALAARVDVGRVSAALGALLAPIYADFAGGSGSAWRAAWMLSAALAVRALGRRPSAVRAFAISVGVGALLDSLIGFDVSFVLSVMATSGLFAIGGPLVKRLSGNGAGAVRRFLVGSGAATLSATIPCAPILATLGPRITIAGMLANVAAVPFGELVSLPLCLVHAIATFRPLERGIALVASGALLVVRAIARTSASATWCAVPVPPPTAWQFAVMAVGAAGVFSAFATRAPRRGSLAVVAAWIAGTTLATIVLEVAAYRAGHPKNELRIVALDVGQGDSTLVDLPDGELMLVDGGGLFGSVVDPGVSVLTPLLRMRRRDRVDIAVLSHPHPDHYIGLSSALKTVDVGEFWDTGQGRAQGAGPEYGALLADLAARHVAVRSPDTLCGPERAMGGARVRVLSPCPSFDPLLGPNDNSFVIRVGYGRRAALLMGDAEHETEERLVRTASDSLRADFLKVGHHGSRTSTTPELLSAVRPAFASVSCGVRNRFGHPHATTLETLASFHVAAFRTDRVGSISWRTDGDDVAARIFGDAGRGALW